MDVEAKEEGPVEVASLDCWHANEIIYQAEGFAVDGRAVYVRYRRPYFSVGLGATPDEACGADTFVKRIDDFDPGSITRAVLSEWSEGRFIWPCIDGYHNEPQDPGPGQDQGVVVRA